MTNFELLNQMYNDYFGISLEDDMKKKKDEEIEMHVADPAEVEGSTFVAPPTNVVNISNEEIHKAYKRLDAIEDALGGRYIDGKFVLKDEERIQTIERALCGVLDRLDAIEARIQSHDNDITELLHEAVAPSGHREDHSEISDRLDVIEKEHTSVDPQGSGAVGREHETIRALIDTMDERVTAIEKRHEQKDQIRKWHEENAHKQNIWESLEHKGLAERWEGTLVLTTKGRQVASLFDNGEIEDIRE